MLFTLQTKQRHTGVNSTLISLLCDDKEISFVNKLKMVMNERNNPGI
jgi:hypothetical protein